MRASANGVTHHKGTFYSLVLALSAASHLSKREPLSLVRSAAMIRPNQSRVRTKYLEHYLRTPVLKRQMLRRANASSQANVFQSQIRALPVLVPKLSLQDSFVASVGSVAILKAKHWASCNEPERLFAAVQHRALRGEL